MLIEKISWDSDFFNLWVGKINPGTFEEQSFIKELSAFDLVYIFEHLDGGNTAAIKKYCPQPIDTKVTYKKEIRQKTPKPENIIEYLSQVPSQKLMEVGMQSGIYSRFKIDENFPPHSYERLYLEWIKKSVNKLLAFKVLVYQEPGKDIGGFVTLQQKQKDACIGLFAVDEASRGMGIGKKLCAAAEHYAQADHFETLYVSTQQANTNACALYEKCGFSIDEKMDIYHYWNKKDARK